MKKEIHLELDDLKALDNFDMNSAFCDVEVMREYRRLLPALAKSHGRMSIKSIPFLNKMALLSKVKKKYDRTRAVLSANGRY